MTESATTQEDTVLSSLLGPGQTDVLLRQAMSTLYRSKRHDECQALVDLYEVLGLKDHDFVVRTRELLDKWKLASSKESLKIIVPFLLKKSEIPRNEPEVTPSVPDDHTTTTLIAYAARFTPSEQFDALIQTLSSTDLDKETKIQNLRRLESTLSDTKRAAELLKVRTALYELSPSSSLSKHVIRGFYSICDYKSAKKAIDKHSKQHGSKDETRAPIKTVLDEVNALQRIVDILRSEAVDKRDIAAVSPKLSYVVYNALPYASGGYATRTHGLLSSLKKNGTPVQAQVRPGFPIDVVENIDPNDVQSMLEIDGVPYSYDLSFNRRGRFFSYMLEAAASITSRSISSESNIIQAASNFYAGIPALLSAIRRGVPFVYEIRGFWEVTRLSREPEFIHSPYYTRNTALEFACATLADHVFTLTSDMASTVEAWGVPSEKISIAPNSIDADKFTPQPKDIELLQQLGFTLNDIVIGYAGSFIQYEGLDDLVSVFCSMAEDYPSAKLLMIGDDKPGGGDGAQVMPALRSIAESSGVGDRIVFTGRVPHEDIQRYYSIIDICPFPRKPLPVTELVSPLKPLEAMAMGKCVIASSVGGMREMVLEGVNGLVFDKGSLSHLRDRLAHAITEHDVRRQLGDQAREWVAKNRSWREVAKNVADRHRMLLDIDPAARKSRSWNTRTNTVVGKLKI